jgi:hypothetical protein
LNLHDQDIAWISKGAGLSGSGAELLRLLVRSRDGEIRATDLADSARKLLKDFCVAVVAGVALPDESDAFLRQSISGAGNAVDRDSLFVLADRLLKTMDESVAMASGISLSAYQNFKKRQAGMDATAESGRNGPGRLR